MPIRRFVFERPRLRVLSNADLDVVFTLREAYQPSSVDSVTATVPVLGDPIDLNGFHTFRGQLRATAQVGSANITSSVGDNTPRATLAIEILGDAGLGQLRARTNALRLWAMQQSRVIGGVFDITGIDADGVVWSLVSEGEFDLVQCATSPHVPSASSPAALPQDRYDPPEDLDAVA